MLSLLMTIGGLIALGANGSSNKAHYMKMGGDVAHTCHESYIRTGACHHAIHSDNQRCYSHQNRWVSSCYATLIIRDLTYIRTGGCHHAMPL